MQVRRHPVPSMCALLLAITAVVTPVQAVIAQQSSKTLPPKKSDSSKSDTPKLRPSAIDPELKAAIETAPQAADWKNNNYARLLDIGNVTVQSDGTVIAEYRETYKLFNERARPLAEVALPFNSGYQSVRITRARTIKKDGTIVNVKPEDIRESEPYSEYLMYDDAKSIGFSMPAIEDDCVIDYSYQMITRPLLMPGQFWTYWGFSGPEPVGVSRYTLRLPADKTPKYKVYNDDALQPMIVSSVDGKTKTYTWERKNIKPIEVEPMMPNVHDVRIWMEVSSLDSWQDVSKWFWGMAKPQAKATDSIKATVAKLITDKKTDDEKARAIYDWVANRTRYVGIEFGLSAFQPHSAADVHDKLYGDCKDKATLLITMLGLAGIKAHPVLLHAEERRPVGGGLPTLNAFNHCIALADVAGKEVWLDATAETCAYGDIPDGDRGAQALVVRDGKGEFKTIPAYQPEENGVSLIQKVVVQPDGSAQMQTELAMRGEAGQGVRASVRALTPDKRKEMIQQIAQVLSTGAQLKEFTLPDGTDKSGAFVMKIDTTAPNFAKKTGSLLLLPIAAGSGGKERNPFSKETRVWPIVQESASLEHSELVITLPEGYTVEDVPADVHLVCPLQEYTRTLTKSADGKTITVVATATEKAAHVPPSEYAKIKAYYDDVAKTAGDQIVLKKGK